MAEYNYVELSDIPYKGQLSDSQVENIIMVVEQFIEWYCQDFFYAKSITLYFDGNGKRSIFFQGMHDIVSCTKIEKSSVNANNVETLTEISAAKYVVDYGCVTKRSSRWAIGLRNYKFSGTIGHGNTDLDGNNDDRYYTRTGIPEAVKTLVHKIISEFFDHAGGGTVKATPAADKFQKESIGDYSYTLKKMQESTLASENPTGNTYADMILRTYARRDPVFMILDEQQEADVYDSLFESIYAGQD